MNGWSQSAQAWIDTLGPDGATGDRGRQFVLDPVFLEFAARTDPCPALDVGCGEGRLCRKLAARGFQPTGLDPTPELLARARALDPGGRYVEAGAEAMPFPDGAFPLVISCLSLIDIPDYRTALAEMARVLAPGGRLWIANLAGWNTAGSTLGLGWQPTGPDGRTAFGFDHYLEERSAQEAWRGIRVINHHRPLSAYMQALLAAGLALEAFDEPAAVPGADPVFALRYNRAPWFLTMVWRKPAGPHGG